MANVMLVVKGEGLRAATKQVFGFEPAINYSENYLTVKFDESQINIMRAYVNMQLEKKEPGDIRIPQIGTIILPPLLKKFWPYLAGVLIAGFVIGKKF
jgi:hypothetical protein